VTRLYRGHLRRRPAEDTAVKVLQLLWEIRYLGCQGSSNVIVRYITQGRVEADRPHLSHRRAARLLLGRPGSLTPASTRRSAISPPPAQMTALARQASCFAALLTPDQRNGSRLRQWITTARAPDLHAFANGLDLDLQARHFRPRPAVSQRPHRRRPR
jgi:hypothetical protein